MINKRRQLTESRSTYGSARTQGFAALRGPQSISADDIGGQPFYGWPTLTIELRAGRPERVESRSIYANLHDSKQGVAVLRAVRWDAREVLEASRKVESSFELALPARFVQCTTSDLQAWLAELEDLQIAIREQNVPRSDLVRRIRIERDYISDIFERVWLFSGTSRLPLDLEWERLWEQTTALLSLAPVVASVDEDYTYSIPEFRHDIPAYQGSWFSIEQGNRPK